MLTPSAARLARAPQPPAPVRADGSSDAVAEADAGLPAGADAAPAAPERRAALWSSRALTGAILAAQLAYPRVPARRRRQATQGIVGLMTAAAVTSLVARRGLAPAAALAGSAAAVGTGAELLGVRTGRPFGRYHYGRGLGPKLAGVPLGVPAAWTMMAPAAWSTAGQLRPDGPGRVLLAAGALTAWDVALDPRMVRDGFWRWERPGRYEGIPLTNFAGWFATGTVLFGAWSRLDPAGRPADRDLALYGWTWTGEVVANLVFWHRPRVALAAGVTLGGFALPALKARLHA